MKLNFIYLFLSSFLLITHGYIAYLDLSYILSKVSSQNFIYAYRGSFSSPAGGLHMSSNIPTEILESNPTSWSFSAWIQLHSSPTNSLLFRFQSSIPAKDHLLILRNGLQLTIMIEDNTGQKISLTTNNLPINSKFFLYAGYKSSNALFYWIYDQLSSQFSSSFTEKPVSNIVFPSNNNWDISIGQDFPSSSLLTCGCDINFRFYYNWAISYIDDKLIVQLMGKDISSLLATYLFGYTIHVNHLYLDLDPNIDTCPHMDTYIACDGGQYFTLPTEINSYYPTGQMCMNIFFSSLQGGGNQTLISVKCSSDNGFMIIKAKIDKESSTIQYYVDVNVESTLINPTFPIILDNWCTVCFIFIQLDISKSIFSIYHSGINSSPITISGFGDNEYPHYSTEFGVHPPNQDGFFGRIKSLRIYHEINPINLYTSTSPCSSSIGFKQIDYVNNNKVFTSHYDYSCLECTNIPTINSFCSITSPCYGNCCDQSCQSCSGPSSSDCLTCYNDILYQSASNTCAWKICTSNTYLNQADNTCRPCDSNCNKCQGSGSCLECNIGYYYDTLTSSCRSCHLSCQTCSGALSTNCLSCSGSYLTSNMECVSSCSPEYIFLPELKCVNTCPYYYFGNPLTSYCENCPVNCLVCSDSLTCLECSNTYYLNNNECLTDCPFGYYKNIIGNIGACSVCDTTCKTCNNQGPSSCTSCFNGFWLNEKSQTCQQCHKNCINCYGPSFENCTQSTCIRKTFLSNDGCIDECPSGFYGDNTSRVCYPCDSNCMTCKGNNSNDCLSCFEDNELNEGNCIQSSMWLNLILGIISTVIVCLSSLTLNMTNLWMWLSTNQLIYLMNFINVNFPNNLDNFLNNWVFSLIQYSLKFPIKLTFPTQNPDTKFLLKDINSFFFANSLASIITITLAFVIIILCELAKKCFNRKVIKYTKKRSFRDFFKKMYLKVYSSLKWNFIIRYISSSYIMMCLYCYLQNLYIHFTCTIEAVSYITGSIILIGLGIFPIWSIYFLRKQKNKILSLKFVGLYGALYSDYRTNNFLRIIFGSLYLIWIQIFVGIIVILYSDPLMVIAIESSLLILMVIYVSLVQPYTEISLNLKALATYSFIFISYTLCIVFLFLEPNGIWADYFGWIIIFFLILITLNDVIYFFYETIRKKNICKLITSTFILYYQIFRKRKQTDHDGIKINASFSGINLITCSSTKIVPEKSFLEL